MKLFRTDYPLTSSFDLVSLSFNLLRKNIWPVFYLLFLPVLIATIGIVIIQSSYTGNTLALNHRAIAGIIVMFIGGLLSFFTAPGALIMQLDAVRGGEPQAFDSFKRGLRYIGRYFVQGLVIGLALVLAMSILVTVLFLDYKLHNNAFIILLIIAISIFYIIIFLLLYRSFLLAKYYIIDKNMGPIGSLKQSRADSLPNAGYIWGVIGVAMLFSMMGSISQVIPVVGNIITIAVGLIYSFAPAFRYNEIADLKLPQVADHKGSQLTVGK